MSLLSKPVIFTGTFSVVSKSEVNKIRSTYQYRLNEIKFNYFRLGLNLCFFPDQCQYVNEKGIPWLSQYLQKMKILLF